MSWLLKLCQWIQAFPTSKGLRESQYAYPAIETTHILGMTLFFGLIVMMDLRLAGIGNLKTPFTQVQKRLFPIQISGFAVSVITGMMLLYADPMRFYTNIFWWIKLGLLFLAGVNMMAFHLTTYRSVAAWDNDAAETPFPARLAGVLSIVFWAGVLIAGRLIAYNWFK